MSGANSPTDPANAIFQRLLDEPEAREELALDPKPESRAVGIALDDTSTLLSVRAAGEFADDLEAQAQQEGWLEEAEGVVGRIREATEEATN